MPIELNNQTVGDIQLNGNTIGEVQLNGTTVYTSKLPVVDPGLHLYRSDDNNNRLEEFVFDDPPFGTSVTSEGFTNSPTGVDVTVTFDPTGERVYEIERGGNTVNAFQLSTPFDLINSTFTSLGTFTLNASNSRIMQPTFNNDGSVMYVNGGEGDSTIEETVYQYTLGTEFDIQTAQFDTSVQPPGSFTGGMGCVAWNDDGTRMYLGQRNAGSQVYQYELSTPFDISTITSKTEASFGEDPTFVQASRNGDFLYVLHHSPNDLERYELSTPFDITTRGNLITIFDNANNEGLFISGPPQYD
jgi:hypothetical protein